jgi:hypothetical protein
MALIGPKCQYPSLSMERTVTIAQSLSDRRYLVPGLLKRIPVPVQIAKKPLTGWKVRSVAWGRAPYGHLIECHQNTKN